MNNKIKKVLCKNWLDNKCKFTKKECIFAHGESDISKNNCFNDIKCWNEKCIYNHSKNWNPFDNKEECVFCPKGFCDKINNKYKHIKNTDENNKCSISKLPKEDFPEIIKNKNINNLDNNLKCKFSDVLTSNLKDVLKIQNINSDYSYEKIDEYVKTEKEIVSNVNFKENIKDDNLIDIKKRLQNKYIALSKISKDDWANSIDIENIEKEIDIINLEYEKLKIINKKENDIFDYEELNLDVIFDVNDNIKKYENNFYDVDIPNISLTINVNYDKCDNNKNIIENMEREFEINISKIKQNINNNIKNNYYKYILINNLNEIKKMIYLFKINYEDIIKH